MTAADQLMVMGWQDREHKERAGQRILLDKRGKSADALSRHRTIELGEHNPGAVLQWKIVGERSIKYLKCP